MISVLLVRPERHNPAEADHPKKFFIKADTAPLDLATIAALTPDDIEVDIWDEAIHGQIASATKFPKDYALVGVTGYTPDRTRAIQIGRVVRERHIPAVAGGVGVSQEPHLYREHFDVLFMGEAEYTWPRFLSDLKSGRYRHQYRQVGKVAMTDSPPPRWNSIAAEIDSYGFALVQTTRGCPFDCEYCDVVALFGRRPRHKSIEQVLEEIRTLQRIGARQIFIADDNLYGDPRYAKTLLRAIAALNTSFRQPLFFFTQITLNVAKDEEMLALLAEANLTHFLVGIESPNKDGLVEAHKLHNYRLDLVNSVKKIQSYGLRVAGSLIVGFDHDDASIFERQFELIQSACLTEVAPHILRAVPGTKLSARLQEEDRLLELPSTAEHGSGPTHWVVSNFVPKNMSSEELLSGYRDLVEKVYDWRNFEARAAGFIANLQRTPPLMPRTRGWVKRRRLLRVLLFTAAGRRAIWRAHRDREVQQTKRRLFQGAAGPDPFLRRIINDLVTDQHQMVTYVVPGLLRKIDEELVYLAATGMRSPVRPVFTLPEAFRKPYKGLFPSLYKRVHRGLGDKSRVENALVEAVCDFLTRWGPTFRDFEDRHRKYLEETCDRVIARENRKGDVPAFDVLSSNSGVFDENGEDEVPSLQRDLADEVLRCVRRELQGHLG